MVNMIRVLQRLARSKYPCCHGSCLVRRIRGVPMERYGKTCPACGRVWDVRVTLLSDVGGVCIEKWEWEN